MPPREQSNRDPLRGRHGGFREVAGLDVLRLVSSGPRGRLYEAVAPGARDTVPLGSAGEGFALKLANRPGVVLDEIQERLETLASVRHEGWVRPERWGCVDECPFIVRPFLEGARTLAAHARRNALDGTQRIRLIRDAVAVVAALEAAGAAHGALTSGNVLVDRTGRVRIVDAATLAPPLGDDVALLVDRLGELVRGRDDVPAPVLEALRQPPASTHELDAALALAAPRRAPRTHSLQRSSVAMLVGVLLGGVLGWPLARRSLQPVHAAERAARRTAEATARAAQLLAAERAGERDEALGRLVEAERQVGEQSQARSRAEALGRGASERARREEHATLLLGRALLDAGQAARAAELSDNAASDALARVHIEALAELGAVDDALQHARERLEVSTDDPERAAHWREATASAALAAGRPQLVLELYAAPTTDVAACTLRAQALMATGALDEAVAEARQARLGVLAADDPRNAARLCLVEAGALHALFRNREAEPVAVAALAYARELASPRLLQAAREQLASVLEAAGDPKRAAELTHESYEASAGPERFALSVDLARRWVAAQRVSDAEELFARVVPEARAELGEDDELVATLTNAYAELLAQRGALSEDEQLLRAARENDTSGAQAQAALDAARSRFAGGDLDGAAQLLSEALRGARRGRAPDDPAVLALRAELARVAVADERFDDAVEEWLTCIEVQRESHGPEHPRTLSTELELARTLRRSGDPDGALHWARHASDGLARLEEDTLALARARRELGHILLALGRPEDAVEPLRMAHAALVEAPEARADAPDAAADVVDALLASGRAEEAERVARAELDREPADEAGGGSAESGGTAGGGERARLRLRSLLGRSLVALDRLRAAEETLLPLVQGASRPPQAALLGLVELYERLQEPELAAAYRAQLESLSSQRRRSDR